MDADNYVSILGIFLIYLIKCLAENNIMVLSPNSLGILFCVYLIYIINNYIDYNKWNKIIFSLYNKKNFLCHFIKETGKILKSFTHFLYIVFVYNIISADYLLVLPWKNNIKNKISYLIYVLFLLFNIKNSLIFNRISVSTLTDRIILIRKYEHISKHKRPFNDEEFGYYLAGLIEGDGYIGKRSIEISFHISDISLAYYIKKRIGYGNIIKYTHTEKAVRYSVWNKEGIKKIFHLINGKFFMKYKIDQIIKYNEYNNLNFYILPCISEKYSKDLKEQKNWLINNYWLCGFSDADASFTIHLSKSKSHKLGYNLKLEYKVVQKNKEIMISLIEAFGGHYYYDDKSKVYRYRFASLKEQHKVIDYFDKYQLNSSKYLRYLKWRKCYRLYLEKQHLSEIGIKKILIIINSLRD